MRIIKRGENRESQPWQANCGDCGTVFSFESSDVQYHSQGTLVNDPDAEEGKSWAFSNVYHYVACPVCSRKIRLVNRPEPRYFPQR